MKQGILSVADMNALLRIIANGKGARSTPSGRDAAALASAIVSINDAVINWSIYMAPAGNREIKDAEFEEIKSCNG